MQDIAGAIEAVFSFLIYERDPDKQARRAANREYKLLKKAVWHAAKMIQWQDELNSLPIVTADKTIRRKRELYQNRVAQEKRTFQQLLALE